MSIEGEQPSVVAEVTVGGGSRSAVVDQAPATVSAKAGADQPLQRDAERAQAQPRNKGKFAERETVRPKPRGLIKDDIRAALAGETDEEALDGVKPTGQDPAAKTDQRQPSKKGTLDTGKDGPADTTQSPELEKARAALKLDRWTDEKLSILTDEQILALGKSATDEHAAKYREGREQAAAAKNGKKPETAADGGDEEAAEFESLAKEHFADFDDEDGKFGKSLAGFAKATHAKVRASMDREIGAIALEARGTLERIQKSLESKVTYEIGLRELSDEFPKSATPEGRKALSARVEKALRDDADADVQEVTRREANALWADEIRKGNAAREQKLRAARSGAHADMTSMGEAPRKKGDREMVSEIVREHIFNKG